MNDDLKQRCIESLIERVKDIRYGADRDATIAEMRLMQMHGADWPNATVAEWNESANAAIERGFLRQEFEDCDKLFYITPPAKASGGQLDLFAV